MIDGRRLQFPLMRENSKEQVKADLFQALICNLLCDSKKERMRNSYKEFFLCVLLFSAKKILNEKGEHIFVFYLLNFYIHLLFFI